MKTKLLLFLLVATSFANAQFNNPILTQPTVTNIAAYSATINYSVLPNGFSGGCSIQYSLNSNFNPLIGNVFSISFGVVANYVPASTNLSGLLPGTLYYVRVIAENQQGSSTSSTVSFTTLAGDPVLPPTITAISSSNITDFSATINYSLNANNGIATSLVRYGTDSNNLSSSATGGTSGGNIITSINRLILGLEASTQYFYRVEATNAAGTALSEISTFTTNPGSLIPIIQYNFDNTLNNVNGNQGFGTHTGVSFVQDRFLEADKALRLNTNSNPTYTIMTGLPNGNNSRTISIWIRPTQVNADNVIFTYGSSSGNSAYGGSFDTSKIYNFSYSSNLAFTTTIVANVWKHIVYTYDKNSSIAKIYIDGILVNSGSFPSWNTGSSGYFYLGSLFGSGSYFNGDIDDLKIFNRAITATEVTNLFNNNTLSSQNFNQNNLEVSLYPNPANDVLNIEMTNEVKSIEIYNIQGQKVKSNNQKQINVSDLANGMYMIKIQDTDNAVSTKKFIKN